MPTAEEKRVSQRRAFVRQRPKSILIWLTADELEGIRKAAEADYMPLTSWVRRLALLQLRERGLLPAGAAKKKANGKVKK